MPYMPNVSLNSSAELKPTNYSTTVRDFYGPGDADISQLMKMNAWSVFDPQTWFVCIRDRTGKLTVFGLGAETMAGKIGNADQSMCAGAIYSPLPPDPNA